jgi:universal stress protein A
MFSPKTILVPTDFSEYSDRALQLAIDIGKQHGSKIYLLHVSGITQQCTVDYCIDSSLVERLERASADASREMMQAQVSKFPGAGSIEITRDIKKGVAYEEILMEQVERKADLIVIASHGRTGLLHHLMGSVAEKVLRGAKCSVLLVKG